MRVLYIAGTGRSGSTLLEIVLGQLPGFAAVGEAIYVWRNGVLEDRLCGCGARFSACPFWADVGDRAFGGWSADDARHMAGLQKELKRLWSTVQLTGPVRSPALEGVLRELHAMTGPLYRAIQDVSGQPLIVDSSKDYRYAVVLRLDQTIADEVVHLVRDSRAVAFSRGKTVIWPDTVNREYMRRKTAFEMSLGWTAKNLLCHALEPSTGRKFFLRYESFVAEPRAQVERLLDWLGVNVPADSLAFLGAEAFEPRVTHTVAGNPVRMQEGPLRIRLDDEWRRKLPRRDRWTANLLTWPLLALYGYVPARPPPYGPY